jgi:tetratricopeptide (TPR) repeat protein
VRVLNNSLLMIAFLAATAAADPQPGPVTPGGDNPWSTGVAQADQDAALALYTDGNVEFENARFDQALDKYEQALAHWNHPAIHFNKAVALNSLGRVKDAADEMDRALVYGAAPLGDDLYQRGLNYRTSFEARLARVDVSCREAGTQVSFDGKPMFQAPGHAEVRVDPGDHQIVAVKQGYQTATEMLHLAPGTKRPYEVHLIALKPDTRYVRRWAQWQPYTVAAGGAIVVGLGALADRFASDKYADYDAAVARHCPHGCTSATAGTFSDLASTKSRADLDRDVAISLFAIGGAAIVAGVVGAVANQPHPLVEHLAPASLPGGGAVLTWSARW